MASDSCEACGKQLERGYTLKGNGETDMRGLLVCFDGEGCRAAGGETWGSLYARIRARRAEQSQGPVAIGAKGVELREGDLVDTCGGPAKLIEVKDRSTGVFGHTNSDGTTRDSWTANTSHYTKVAPPPQGEASGFKVGDVVLEPGEEGREFSIERALGDNCFDLLCPRTGAVHHNVLLDRYSLIGRKTTSGSVAAAKVDLVGKRSEATFSDPADPLHFGPDSYPANPKYGIERRDEEEPKPATRNHRLELFESFIKREVITKLPKGASVVTDKTRNGYVAIASAGGRELRLRDEPVVLGCGEVYDLGLEDAGRFLDRIASALMAERARAGK